MGLLEFKEKIKNFYAEHETLLKPVFKFLAVFISMLLIKSYIGYMDVLNMWIVVLGISVLFAFLPWAIVIIGLEAIIILNIFSLSVELAVIILCTVLIMTIFFFRFTPKEGVFLVLIPMAFFLKIPYVIPIAAGLVCTPVSIVSVSFGTIIYFMLDVISKNALAINNISADAAGSTGINNIVNMIGNNGEMILSLVAFAVTIVVVYLIKRTSINNAWTIAILVGGIVDFVIILIGNIILDTESSIFWLILGTVLSIVLAYVVQFFAFSVDYSRN